MSSDICLLLRFLPPKALFSVLIFDAAVFASVEASLAMAFVNPSRLDVARANLEAEAAVSVKAADRLFS
jgi:hypothetical protein